MRRTAAAIGTATCFVAASGTFAGLIPWLLIQGQIHHPAQHWLIAQAVGAVLIIAGLIPAVSAFVQFATACGTPMPLAPTQRLVIAGFHRFARDPDQGRRRHRRSAGRCLAGGKAAARPVALVCELA
jgi:protein-S-isoprenylcysteine O-methyltransferase Ste14